MSRPLSVLIVGASGVFGSRLAELAVEEPGIALTLAGRRLEPLQALAERLGPIAIRVLDRDRVSAAELEGFDLVVDCAGPFQQSHGRLIEAAIAAGVDYCDLADGRDFVIGIGRFDARATAAGTFVLAGVSSIPALSHAVLDRLVDGWQSVDRVRVGIFPGNRAPRGLSVVEAILSYVGKPVRVFRNGAWTDVPGWALQGRMDCGPAGRRWASVCDTPEQDLLAERYRPRVAAEFVAGLELSLLHLGLWQLAFPVRWGWLRSLRPAAGALLATAKLLQPLGSDRGAMVVEASGVGADCSPVLARWMLDAKANRGPYVPVLPVIALIRRVRAGARPKPGARACSGILALEDFDPLFRQLGIVTSRSAGSSETKLRSASYRAGEAVDALSLVRLHPLR